MLGVEPSDGLGEIGGGRDRDGERPPLPEVAHVDEALNRHLRLRHALGVEPLAGLLLELLELALERPAVDRVDVREEHRRQVVADVDEQAAERGGDARAGRDEHGRNREVLGERSAVQRSGAAERHQAELAGIVAAADRDQADGVRHVRVRDPDGRVRRFDEPEPERGGHVFLDRALGGITVEGHRPADQLFSEPPEDEVRVRVRRSVIPAPVARRPWTRPGRLRTVAKRAGLVDPGERAAAGADRQHLDRREADRVAVLDEPLLRHPLLALVDERDVRRGPAHIEADRVLIAAQRGDMAAGDRAGSDSRCRQTHCEPLSQLRRHHAPSRVQEEHVAVVAVLGQAILEPLDVSGDER